MTAKVTRLHPWAPHQSWSPNGGYVATCDAGDCDDETVAVVLVDEDEGQWVAMCGTHAIHELGGHTQADVEYDE